MCHKWQHQYVVLSRTKVKGHAPPVATSRVDRAVLAPHHKVVHVAHRKGHGGDGHRFALFEDQLQTVLQGTPRTGSDFNI